MDGYQLLASLVGSLAWPLCAVAIAGILYRPIVALMARAISAEGFGTKLTFAQQADAVREAIEAHETVEGQVIGQWTQVLDREVVIPPTATSDGTAALKDELSSTSATGTVVAAWRDLEGTIEGAASVAGIESSVRGATTRTLGELNKRGLISATTHDAILRLRTLRNEVAHGSAASKLSLLDAQAYRASVDSVMATLRSEMARNL